MQALLLQYAQSEPPSISNIAALIRGKSEMKRILEDATLLAPSERAYVKLRFFNDHSMLAALRSVTAGVLPPTRHAPYAAEKIVLLFCGKKVGDAALKRDLACWSDERVAEYKRAGFERMKAFHAAVMEKIRRAFAERGIVLPQ